MGGGEKGRRMKEEGGERRGEESEREGGEGGRGRTLLEYCRRCSLLEAHEGGLSPGRVMQGLPHGPS